jgi:hypothetical protein
MLIFVPPYLVKCLAYLAPFLSDRPTISYTLCTSSMCTMVRSSNSEAVDWATGNRQICARLPVKVRYFLVHRAQTSPKVHPASYTMHSSDVKRPGRETGHAVPSRAEV